MAELTDDEASFLKWLLSSYEQALSEKQVSMARDLRQRRFTRFEDTTDGNFVYVTDAGRAALQESGR